MGLRELYRLKDLAKLWPALLAADPAPPLAREIQAGLAWAATGA